MAHTLKDLYKALNIKTPKDLPDIDLRGITADSRKVEDGWIFVAERGVNVDGHDFIPNAINKGAAVVICERIPDVELPETVWITVEDSAAALGQLASWWYDYPSSKLTLVGVTGTNGKTTIATLIYKMAKMMREKAGLISTVINKIDDEEEVSTHTTPDPININRLLSRMIEKGCSLCAMEVSSHACSQKRIAGLKFAGGIFTNLTRDHLDYHKTFDNYLKAKKSFFDGLDREAFALTNADDKNGMVILQNTKARKYTYSVRTAADYRGRLIEDRIDGMLMAFDGTEVETAFVGAFNASNLTAVYGASLLIGWDRMDVLKNISLLRPVAGRMQTFTSDGITAIVDYAHTPDALANVLKTITEVKGKGGIITVVGAGGNRDKGKRPLMAAEAVKYSDTVIITSDNPRHERAEDIANDMLTGVQGEHAGKVQVQLDRAEAIKDAITGAQQGDIVLIAGKGHETYQIIGDIKHHFDDCEEVKKAFDERKQ